MVATSIGSTAFVETLLQVCNRQSPPKGFVVPIIVPIVVPLAFMSVALGYRFSIRAMTGMCNWDYIIYALAIYIYSIYIYIPAMLVSK